MENLLSKEELLKKVEEDYTEPFEINANGKIGFITIRGFKTTREMDNAYSEIQKLNAQKLVLPQLQKYSEQDISTAVFLSNCIVNPKLDITESLDLSETLGPIVRVIFNRIMQLSGFSLEQMTSTEEKLRKDTFPSSSINGMSRSSKTSSRRS